MSFKKNTNTSKNMNSNNNYVISGHAFDFYKKNFSFASSETIANNKKMHFNINQNSFVKYKDQGKKIIQIKNKLPAPTYPNVCKII